MTTKTRTISFEMTWRHAAQIIAAALENGTGAGREAARTELARMADILDALKASENDPTPLYEVITQASTGQPQPFGQTFDTEAAAAGYADAMTAAGYHAEVSPEFATQPTIAAALNSAADFYGRPEIVTIHGPKEPTQ